MLFASCLFMGLIVRIQCAIHAWGLFPRAQPDTYANTHSFGDGLFENAALDRSLIHPQTGIEMHDKKQRTQLISTARMLLLLRSSSAAHNI
jgi:hypothetical protein